MSKTPGKTHYHELMELFEEATFREKFHRTMRGLTAPKESGDHKFAMFQVARLSAPISAIVVPCVVMSLLLVFAGMRPPPPTQVEVQIIEPEMVEDLEDIEELIEEPLEPPEPIEMDFSPDIPSISDSSPVPGPPEEFSPQPAEFDSVALVRSPVLMKGIIGNRSPGARGAARREFGGSGVAEGAVLRALRWLKKEQHSDGSWPKNKPAMTGLALLTFLAHGETPASEEFGPSVEKGIRWLIDNQQANGGWPRSYQHAIAAYAICEAYSLTRVPMLRDTAERAVEIIIRGQNPTGGWRYAYNPGDPDDTSCMGWCAQALKAAKMGDLNVEGLDDSIKLAIQGFKKNAHPEGGFGYTGPGKSGLTGIGVLCMQLLGASQEPEVRRGLVALEDATFNWEPTGKFNKNYYWYYITQAKFHTGGKTWNEWNSKFAEVLVKNQTVIEDAIIGPDGELKDIGFWDMEQELSGHTDGPTMNTALCALQLQVYYRYLPTYKTPEATYADEGAEFADDVEIDIDISLNE